MYKILSISLMLFVILAATSFAQERPVLDKNVVNITVEPTNVSVESKNIGSGTLAANYVFVDKMQNSYGAGIATCTPIAYDPFANLIALIHRGGPAGLGLSGELYYNHSQDGVNWTRTPGSMTQGISSAARYPNFAILNGTQSSVLADLGAVAAWPHLTPSAFGNLGYAIDLPIGGGDAFAVEVIADYGTSITIWTSDNSDWVYWVADKANSSLEFYRTQDYATVNQFVPPTWDSTSFASANHTNMGGVSHNGVLYYGTNSFFPNLDNGDWPYPGYSKSTDNGTTWSDWNICDFRQIPVLSEYDLAFFYRAPVGRSDGDINVDKDGRVHFVVALTDTADVWTSSNKDAVVELYEDPTAPSGWNAKIIYDGLGYLDWRWHTIDNSPNITQMGSSPYLAFDEDREILVCQWVASANAINDTSVMDIYYAWRTLDGEWSAPINLTNTPEINEAGSHLAPMMKKEAVAGGVEVTFYSMYWYAENNTSYVINTLDPNDIFVASVTQFVPVTSVDDGVLLNSFVLEQNYPNPFNPATKISYTLAERSNVSLKVYDVLGKEVASLVNTSQDAGTHQVNFDASSLSTGLYIYTLNAGNFTSSKKMMLIK